MPHFTEMPNGIQNQLEKVDCQLLGHHGETVHKVQANQCLKRRNKARITKQFAKKRGRPSPDLVLQRHSSKTNVLKSPLTQTERAIQIDIEMSQGAEILICLKHIVQYSQKDIVFLIHRKALVRMNVNF